MDSESLQVPPFNACHMCNDLLWVITLLECQSYEAGASQLTELGTVSVPSGLNAFSSKRQEGLALSPLLPEHSFHVKYFELQV